MEYDSTNCPCKKEKCARHGDCAACRAHHAERQRPTACERLAAKAEKLRGIRALLRRKSGG